MGKQIHLEKIEQLFEKSPLVTFSSIERIIQDKKNRSNYAKLLVSNLLKKGKIKRISKGIYTKHNENTLAVLAFNPAYLGLQSSLSHYGIWKQETIPIILTTKKVRRGIRNIFGTNVLIRNINKKYFFGFEFVKEGNFYLPYSNLEKTLIDLIIFNQNIDTKNLNKIKRLINKKKLNNYLKRYPKKIKNRVEKYFKN